MEQKTKIKNNVGDCIWCEDYKRGIKSINRNDPEITMTAVCKLCGREYKKMWRLTEIKSNKKSESYESTFKGCPDCWNEENNEKIEIEEESEYKEDCILVTYKCSKCGGKFIQKFDFKYTEVDGSMVDIISSKRESNIR